MSWAGWLALVLVLLLVVQFSIVIWFLSDRLVERFRDRLRVKTAEKLVEADGISMVEALEIVRSWEQEVPSTPHLWEIHWEEKK